MSKASKMHQARNAFAVRHGVPSEWVYRLAAVATRAHRAGERYCSEDRPGLERALDLIQEQVGKVAAEHGYAVVWPGLWPLLTKDGIEVMPPD